MAKRLFRTEVKWGIIFTLMMAAWLLIDYAAGFQQQNLWYHEMFSLLVFMPAIAVYYFALLDVRKTMGGFLPWLMAIRSGLVIGLVVAVLSPVYLYVFFTWVNPGFTETFAQYTFTETRQFPTLELARDYFSFRSYALQAAWTAPLMGLATAAGLGFFLKKDPPVRPK